MQAVGLTGFLASQWRALWAGGKTAICILAIWAVQPATSQVLSYAHIDETPSSAGNQAAQIDAGFTLYWSLYDVNQEMRRGRAVDFLLLSGAASTVSAHVAITNGILADTILVAPIDTALGALPSTPSFSKQIKDLSAGPVMQKNVQISLLRLPAGAAGKINEILHRIAGLPMGSEGALAFVCAPDPLTDLPKALSGESAPRGWQTLYFFQNCLALWQGKPDNQIANEKRNMLPLEQIRTGGYRMVTLPPDGPAVITERSRSGEASKTEPSADKMGDLVLAEAFEKHGRLEESEAKYELALVSTDEAVRRRAVSGLERVFHRLNLWNWLSRLVLLLIGIAIGTVLSVGALDLHSLLLRRRGAMILRVESLVKVKAQAMPEFVMHVQRQEKELLEVVGESFLARGDATTILVPPPSQLFPLDDLPSLSIAKVDVKSVLQWIRALVEYFDTRHLVVWVGTLSTQVMLRASIQSGWTTQSHCTLQAETEEDAAWQLVTWAVGFDASR